MVNIPMRTSDPVNGQTVLSLNKKKIAQPLSSATIASLNRNTGAADNMQNTQNSRAYGGTQNTQSSQAYGSAQNTQTYGATQNAQAYSGAQNTPTGSFVQRQTSAYETVQPAYSAPGRSPANQAVQPAYSASGQNSVQAAPAYSAPQQAPAQLPDMQLPQLTHTIQKGQKVPLGNGVPLQNISVKMGWNVNRAECDVDVSAFLLGDTGKVPGDDWFVFYGQPQSPDGSTIFSQGTGGDREEISVNFDKLNPAVSKIVFVLTINEALEKRLNFSMVRDAYIRILDSASGAELVSFLMTDYYANVTSMMIGELYLYKGAWKFNAVGNGVAKDLAGLCELYGVQVE